MNEHSASTLSNDKPLYRDTRQPSTERWPASMKNITHGASTENISKATTTKGEGDVNLDQEVFSTGQAKKTT